MPVALRAKRKRSGFVYSSHHGLQRAAAAAVEPLERRVMLSSTPSWLDPNSAATWDSSTHVLTVTGAATIVANPGSDNPQVTVSGSGAALMIEPGTDKVIQLGNLTLTNGGCAELTRPDAGTFDPSSSLVLVVGTQRGNSPVLSIDSADGSTLGLEDNHLLVHQGMSSESNYILGLAVQSVGMNGSENLDPAAYAQDAMPIAGSDAAQQLSVARQSLAVDSGDILIGYDDVGSAPQQPASDFSAPGPAVPFGMFGGSFAAADSSDAPSSPISGTTPAEVSSVIVNGNIPSLSGPQRSMVDSIQYTFSEPVTLNSTTAFSIAVTSGQSGTVPTLSWSALSPDGSGASTQWVVSFSGSGVVGNSIADGVYDITLNTSAVTSEANPTVPAQPHNTDTFFRLFGDINGDGLINAYDNFQFKKASTTYNAAFDYNDDTVIDGTDTTAFDAQTGKSFAGLISFNPAALEPTAVTAVANSPTAVAISWTAPTNGAVSGYRIQYWSVTDSAWEPLVQNLPANSTTYTATALSNTAYEYQVAAEAEGRVSDWSESSNDMTTPMPPVTPEISGPSVGFFGKSLTFNADVGQAAAGSSLSYQWNLLNQYGSPYTPPGGLPDAALSSFVLPGSVPAGSYSVTLAVTESGSPTQTATFPLEILSDPQDSNLIYGTVPSVGGDNEGQVTAMVRQADGKIVVAGYWGASEFDNTQKFGGWYVARFNPDLSLDTSFTNYHGSAIAWDPQHPLPGYFTSIQRLAINPVNQDIIVIGTGNQNTSIYDSDSTWQLQVAELVSKETVKSDGTVLSPGSYDPAFHNGTPFDYTATDSNDHPISSIGEDVQVLPTNGDLLVGGAINDVVFSDIYGEWTASGSDFLLLELTPDGQLDTTNFNGTGVAEQPGVSGAWGDLYGNQIYPPSTIFSLAVDSQGNIYAGGVGSPPTGVAGSEGMVIVKYSSGGTLYNSANDPTDVFGSDGEVYTDCGAFGDSSSAFLSSLELLPNGNLLMVGQANPSIPDPVSNPPSVEAHVVLAEYDSSSGALNTLYGTGGIVNTCIDFESRPAQTPNLPLEPMILGPAIYPQELGSFVFESDGNIVASLLTIDHDGAPAWQLVQFVGDDGGVNAPGTLDTSFGNGGAVSISAAASDWSFSTDANPGILLVSGDSIIVGGTTESDYQPVQNGADAPATGYMTQPLVVRYLLQQPAAGNLSAQQTSSGAVSLSWSVTLPGQTGFDVERSSDGDTWPTIAQLGPDQTDYVDGTASPDTQYSYRVVPLFSGPAPDYAAEEGTPSAPAGIYTGNPTATSNVFQEAVQVPLSDTTVSSTTNLTAGQYYLIEASGLVHLDSDVTADPAYWYASTKVRVGECPNTITQDLSGNQFSIIDATPTSASVENYGLAVNAGGTMAIPDWGIENTDQHSYFYVVQGTGSPVSFALQGTSNFADTAGVESGDKPLEVEIYQIKGTPVTPPTLPSNYDGTVTVQLTSVTGLGEGASSDPALPVLSAPDVVGVSVSGLPTDGSGSWQLSLVPSSGPPLGNGTSNGTYEVNLDPQSDPDGVYSLQLTANYPPPSPGSPPPPPPVSVSYKLVLAAPVMQITSPATAPDGVTPVVSSSMPIDVLSANPDGSQNAWSLYLVSSSNSTDALLASSSDSVGTLPGYGATVATLDPSLYPNGTYQLELENAQSAVVDSRTVTIATAVKQGTLQLPVTDGTVNTASGPVSITRTYDSGLVNVPPPTSGPGGDPVAPNFGPGWSFSMLDARLSTSAEADTANPGSTTPVLRAGDVVYLTVPDGGQQAFEFDPIPVESPTTFSASQSSIEYLANFIAMDGSGAKLTFNFGMFAPFYSYQDGTQAPQRLYYDAADNEFGYPGATGGLPEPSQSFFLDPVDDTTFIGFNPADFRAWPAGDTEFGFPGAISGGSYTLTEKDGTSYSIDATTGAIESVKDQNGNTTTYNYASGSVTAVNSLGATLFTVATNSSNQVTQIVIPGQNSINYGYTSADLTSVENQASQTTSYAYQDSAFPHFLTSITNPQNQTILQAQYNSAGVLDALVNVKNVTMPVTYGHIGSDGVAQTVVDAAGNMTEEFFSEQYGTPLRKIQTETDSSGDITGYTVTINNYNYVNNAVGQMSALYPSGEQVLQSVQGYMPFEIQGSDPNGQRLVLQPGPDSLLSQTTYDTVGDISAPGYEQVLTSSAAQDNSGTLQTTIYSNYAIVDTTSGKVEPLLTTVEIQTPDANQPTGYDSHIQSQTYTTYTNAGQVDYSLNVIGRQFGTGLDDEVGVFSDLGQGNYPPLIYLTLSGFSVDDTTQTLKWNASDDSYEWSDGDNASITLEDTTLVGRGSGTPLAGDLWQLTIGSTADGLSGTSTFDNLSFDGSPLGLSNLVTSLNPNLPTDERTGHQIQLSVPDFIAQGTEYSYTSGGAEGAKDTLVSETDSITANIGLDGSISGVQEVAKQSQNAYYTNNDFHQDPETGQWVPNSDVLGASYGQVEYSFNAAGQETFYAYNASGQAVLQYVYKQWTDSSGDLVDGWVGTTNVYDSAGRQTDTYSATYADPTADTSQPIAFVAKTLPVTTDGDGGIEIDTNSADSSYVTVYAAAVDTQHTDYNTLGQVEDTKDQYGGVTTYTYDASGNKIETNYPNGTGTLNVYDGDNRVIWTTNQFDPSADAPNKPVLTHTIYNALGQTIETDTFDGGTITITSETQNGSTIYSSTISTTTIDGIVTPDGSTFVSASKSFYDAAGHVIETIGPSGLRTGSIYYPNGKVEYTGPLNSAAPDGGEPIINSNGSSTSGFTRSDFQVDSSTGFTTTLNNQFDLSLGLFYTQTIDQNSHATDVYTDALGRTVRTVYPDSSFTEMLYGYGSSQVTVDQEAQGIDPPTSWQNIPSGGSETISIAQRKSGDPVLPTYDVYDAANNLVAVYQPLVEDMNPADTDTYYPTTGQMVNPRTTYAYDTAGNETSQTDADGNLTQFGYDQNGNQVLQILQDGQSETWTYNVNNQVTSQTDFDGNTATYTYVTDYSTPGTNAGDLLSVVYAGEGKDTQTVRYTYNDLNQQATVTDASGETIESYDDFGNLTESNTPEGIISYVFDPATGNHTETYTANTQTWYGYDLQGRLTSVTVKELNGNTITPLTTTYGYDPAGNKLTELDPNGDLITYGYDSLNRLTDETITDGSTTLFSQTYTLNDDGTRWKSSESQLQTDGSTVVTYSTTWTYDALRRLTGEAVTSSDPSQSYSDSFTYDLASNRMADVHTGPAGGPTGTTAYQYNGDDELIHSGQDNDGDGIPDTGTETTNEYDDNGSLLNSSTGGVATATYTYDVRNKMVGYSDSSTTASYIYDDAGNRVQENANGVTTYYLTDTQNPTGYAQPIEQKSSKTATPNVTYFLGDRVIAQADGSSNVAYLLPDGHGSTEQLAGNSVTPTAAFQYDAFGDALNFTPATAIADGVTTGSIFLFGGDAVYDPASGLYLHGNGVRPTNGFLFIQRDSGNNSNNQDPPSLHTYLYAEADPIMGLDPSGHNLIDNLDLGDALGGGEATDGGDGNLADDAFALAGEVQAENVVGYERVNDYAERNFGLIGTYITADTEWTEFYNSTNGLENQVEGVFEGMAMFGGMFGDLGAMDGESLDESLADCGMEESCFVAGTDVLMGSRTTEEPVQDIQVGDRVATDGGAANSPDGKAAANPNATEVKNPNSWREITVIAGDWDVQVLEPVTWIRAHYLRAGSNVPLSDFVDLEEMGVPDGLIGVVQAVTACPPIQKGPGRVVLMTVNHLNDDLYTLTLKDTSGATETLGVTGYHPFYDESLGWTQVQNLYSGETLRGADGDLTVVSVTRKPGTDRVYNMTVESDHVYYVGDFPALVHNSCALTPPPSEQVQAARSVLQSESNEVIIGIVDLENGQVYLAPSSSLNGGEGGGHFDLASEQLGVEDIDQTGNLRGFVVGKDNGNIKIIGNSGLNPGNRLADELLQGLQQMLQPILRA